MFLSSAFAPLNSTVAGTRDRVPVIHSGRQRGIALITALFVVALASIAATAMLFNTNIAIQRTENLQDSEAAWWYAQGLESWIMLMLEREARTQKQNVDSLDQPWAQPVAALPFGRGTVSGRLEDLQGRFNLNNLGASNPDQAKFFLQQFRRLLDNLPGIDTFSSGDLGLAIRDWIDADSEPSGPGGAETPYYLSLDPPYRAANRMMTSPSELLLVKGLTPEIYDALRPYVCTLPIIGTKINVNTALAPVLQSLSSSGGSATLDSFLKNRIKQPITEVQSIGQAGIVPAGVNIAQYLDVRTDYFLLHADISVGRAQLSLYSVIRLPQSGSPAVIARNTGAD